VERRDWVRLIDANLNRTREALRVLEDVWRLGDGSALAAAVRRLRHAVAALPARLGVGAAELLAARDVAGDPGAAAPALDAGSDALARNFARATEALRVLEEAARAIGAPDAGAPAEVRFALYGLEKTGAGQDPRRARLLAARLCVLVDPATTARPLPALAAAVAAAGAPLLQVRCKEGTDRARLALAAAVVAAARPHGALVVVNDRADLAAAAGADGVHVGLDDLAPAEARAIVGGHRLVGATAHDADEAAVAVRAPGRPDYLGYGTIFPSTVKPGRAACGPEAAAAVARACPVPVFAIGGITPGNVAACRAAGLERVAVGAGVGRAADPAAAVRALLAALQ
jgi:thiamine-phosphate pyrophosphorylase